jgi:phosphohistidine phosphatase
MPRQLLLLRHAKSSWDDPSLADHDRPLSKRGRKAAAAMRAAILSRDLAPDLALVSTARRARETFAALEPWPRSLRVMFLDALYDAPPAAMLELLHEVEPSRRCVLLVGHNPGLMELANYLAGGDEGALAQRLAGGFPTGAMALFEVESPWSEVCEGSAKLSDFVVPRELKDAKTTKTRS